MTRRRYDHTVPFAGIALCLVVMGCEPESREGGPETYAYRAAPVTSNFCDRYRGHRVVLGIDVDEEDQSFETLCVGVAEVPGVYGVRVCEVAQGGGFSDAQRFEVVCDPQSNNVELKNVATNASLVSTQINTKIVYATELLDDADAVAQPSWRWKVYDDDEETGYVLKNDKACRGWMDPPWGGGPNERFERVRMSSAAAEIGFKVLEDVP